ncbi:MAG TPA: hypothetical protein PKK54_01425 [bacterium]|jgi:hypothetical protein|nr:hypothetical protein [bacterium]
MNATEIASTETNELESCFNNINLGLDELTDILLASYDGILSEHQNLGGIYKEIITDPFLSVVREIEEYKKGMPKKDNSEENLGTDSNHGSSINNLSSYLGSVGSTIQEQTDQLIKMLIMLKNEKILEDNLLNSLLPTLEDESCKILNRFNSISRLIHENINLITKIEGLSKGDSE